MLYYRRGGINMFDIVLRTSYGQEVYTEVMHFTINSSGKSITVVIIDTDWYETRRNFTVEDEDSEQYESIKVLPN